MIKIIDNFLPNDTFESICDIILTGDFPWHFEPKITLKKEKFDTENFKFYMVHLLIGKNFEKSPYYDKIVPHFYEKLNINGVRRIKINFYPYQGKFDEHLPHRDYEYEHKGALFALNTCNGYTKFEDGTKVESVANRMILFDPTKLHCSTNTTDDFRRVNINFNYF